MKKLFLTIAFLMLAQVAWATTSTVSGTMRLGNGSTLNDSTVTFTLNQSGIVAGSYALVTSGVNCGTSTDGTLVGITRPLVAPTGTPNTSSGSVPSGAYSVKITYYGTGVETLASPARTITLTATGKITITAPTLQPSNATGYKVYMSTTAGAEKLQATTAGWGNTTVTSLLTATALPSSNNTVCSLQFNDTIIPTYTYYRVSAVAASGAAVPGFPQNWYLAGTSVDVSTVYPLAAVGQQTRFPTPLLLNPSSNALQSVNSPVTLNGYSLTAGAILLPANGSPPACTGTTSLIYTDSMGELKFCQNGATVTGILDWHDSVTGSTTGTQLLLPAAGEVDPASGKYTLLVYDTTANKTILKSHQFGGTDQPEDLQINGQDVNITASATFTSTVSGTMGLTSTGNATITSSGAVALVGATGTVTTTGNYTVTGGGNTDLSGTTRAKLVSGSADVIAKTSGAEVDIDATTLVATVGTATTFTGGGTFTASNVVLTGGTAGTISVRKLVTAYAADGAITIADGVAKITQASPGAYTLADPSSNQEGTVIYIISTTAQAHVLTNASNFYGTSTATATWAAAVGNFLKIIAIAGKWRIISSSGITLS